MMKISSHSSALALMFTLLFQASTAATDPLTEMLIDSGLNSEKAVHPQIQSLISDHGYVLKNKFVVGDGLLGWALFNEREPARSLILYTTPGGLLIHGGVRTADGEPLMDRHRLAYLPESVSQPIKRPGKAGFAISEGTGSVVVDIFLDPQCSFCKDLWRELRSELETVTVHWRPIAIFPGSLSQVAGLMQSLDPVKALATLVSHGTIESHPTTKSIVAGVRNNTQRMQQAGMTATPSGFISLPNGQSAPFQGADVIQTIRSLRY